MKIACITPVGPGHKEVYKECINSIQNAWDNNPGKFTFLEILGMDDLEG